MSFIFFFIRLAFSRIQINNTTQRNLYLKSKKLYSIAVRACCIYIQKADFINTEKNTIIVFYTLYSFLHTFFVYYND